MPSGALTIHGGTGSGHIDYSFTAYGTSTLRYAAAFVSTVNDLLVTGEATPLAPDSAQGGASAQDGVTQIYQLTPGSGADVTYTVSQPAYVIDTIGGGTLLKVTGSDTVLVASVNPHATVNSTGPGNEVIFIDGDNTFNGSLNDSNTTVVTGTGFDTVNTGGGATTVRSGTGDATISLNDTVTGAYNDAVYLDDGHAMVYANGTGDQIVATTAGQTIIGDAASSADVLTVVLLPNSDGSANGNDSVSTGAAYANIIDGSSNNTIIGGSGTLQFFGGAGVTATIETGSGSSLIFGASGDNLTIGTVAGDTGTTAFIASTGNETLNGGLSTANLAMFGGPDNSSTDSLVGGAGNDTLVAGIGTATLLGGAGDNTFLIDSVAGANNASITIGDFNTSDTVAFSGYSASDVANALSSGTDTTDGFVITFGNSTTVTFTGVSSASELTGHIITF